MADADPMRAERDDACALLEEARGQVFTLTTDLREAREAVEKLVRQRDEAIRIEARLRGSLCEALDRHRLVMGWTGSLIERLERALAQLDPPSRRELAVWRVVAEEMEEAGLPGLAEVVRAMVGVP